MVFSGSPLWHDWVHSFCKHLHSTHPDAHTFSCAWSCCQSIFICLIFSCLISAYSQEERGALLDASVLQEAEMSKAICKHVTSDLLIISPQDITIRLIRWKMAFLWTVQQNTVIPETFFSIPNSAFDRVKIKHVIGQRFWLKGVCTYDLATQCVLILSSV